MAYVALPASVQPQSNSMPQQEEITAFLNQLLEADRFADYGPNGLQVQASERITRVATACTSSQAVIDAAVAAQADALLVHHGLFWGGGPVRIVGMLARRIAALMQGGCNLLAYHLPLDSHPRHGNNAYVLDALGISQREPFSFYKGQPIGRWGELASGLSPVDLQQKLAEIFDHTVLHCPGGPDHIQRVGVITGGGQSAVMEAASLGLDAFITGEASEQTWHEAAESGIHCFACGHFATERFAVHGLGRTLAQKFDIEHIELAEVNPI